MRVLAVAEWLFGPDTRRIVFEPLMADRAREIASGSAWLKARWVVAIAAAFVACLPAVVRAPLPPRFGRQLVMRLAGCTALVGAFMAVPLIREIDPRWTDGWWLLFALPMVITLAWPFALIGAVDAIRGAADIPSHAKRHVMLGLAAVATMVMVVASGWLLPATNHEWRTVVFRSVSSIEAEVVPQRGVRELSTYELMTAPERATAHERGVGAFAPRPYARRELSHRAALALLPLVVLWGRWRALTIPAGRWFSPQTTTVATVATGIGFLAARFSDVFVEDVLQLPLGLAAWFPLAILLAAGLMRQRYASRSKVIA